MLKLDLQRSNLAAVCWRLPCYLNFCIYKSIWNISVESFSNSLLRAACKDPPSDSDMSEIQVTSFVIILSFCQIFLTDQQIGQNNKFKWQVTQLIFRSISCAIHGLVIPGLTCAKILIFCICWYLYMIATKWCGRYPWVQRQWNHSKLHGDIPRHCYLPVL